jgi:hypothetical protein
MNEFNNSVNAILNPIFDNEIGNAVLKISLILYGAMAAPRLPVALSPYISNAWVKILIMILIIWIWNKDPGVAILVAVGYYLTIHYILKNGLEWVERTGVVPTGLSNVLSGSTVPIPAAVTSESKSTNASAEISTSPSHTAANVPSMMDVTSSNGTPKAFTPEHIHDFAAAPR